VKLEATQFLKSKALQTSEFEGKTLSEDLLHKFVAFLLQSSVLSKSQVKACIESLRKLYPAVFASVVMAPLLTQEPSGPAKGGVSVTVQLAAVNTQLGFPSSTLRELGFAATESAPRMRDMLSQFPTLYAEDVAEMVSVMLRIASSPILQTDSALSLSRVTAVVYNIGFDQAEPDRNKRAAQAWSLLASRLDTPSNKNPAKAQGGEWNVDVFVSAVNEAFPRMDWKQVGVLFDLNVFFLNFFCLLHVSFHFAGFCEFGFPSFLHRRSEQLYALGEAVCGGNEANCRFVSNGDALQIMEE